MSCTRASFDPCPETSRFGGGRALVGLLAGLLFPFLLSRLPDPAWVATGIALTAVAAACRRYPLALLLAGACWSGLHLQESLHLRNRFASPVETEVVGRVTGLPVQREDLLEFRLVPTDDAVSSRLRKPVFLVRWYREWPDVSAGETWRLQVQLKPARSRLNFSGSDPERWFFSQDIVGLATVRSGERLHAPPGQPLRYRVREAVDELLQDHPARGVLLALTVADRSRLDSDDWTRYRLTGTSHLLAISGMHIGIAALLGFVLGRALLAALPAGLATVCAVRLPWVLGVLLAGWYASLAGLGTSTQRALIMFSLLALVTLSARRVPATRILVLALALILVRDPLQPLTAGFWLSFLAVGVLLMLLVPRNGSRGQFRTLLLAQAGLGLALAPVGLHWFQQAAFTGLWINLLAIPWVSLFVVPLAISGTLLLGFQSGIAAFLLFMAAEAARGMEWVLAAVEPIAQQGLVAAASPGLFTVALATLGVLLCFLPRGVPQRWLGGLLVLPLLLPAARLDKDALQVEMLDVGQGLAVLVLSEGGLLLYDSGPGDGHSRSLVNGVIAPAIAAAGKRAPDRVVISHGDLDHAGGKAELLSRYPGATFYINSRLPTAGAQPCTSDLHWISAGARYQVLHPSPGLPYLGNDSSCVLEIKAPAGDVLLTGDISESVERRLLGQGVKSHDVLLVPHHGSRSSSSKAFIDRIQPRLALVSTAHGNRFGFPHQDVSERYAQQGIPMQSSAACGAIRVSLGANSGLQARSARQARRAPWHWPADTNCP